MGQSTNPKPIGEMSLEEYRSSVQIAAVGVGVDLTEADLRRRQAALREQREILDGASEQ